MEVDLTDMVGIKKNCCEINICQKDPQIAKNTVWKIGIFATFPIFKRFKQNFMN